MRNITLLILFSVPIFAQWESDVRLTTDSGVSWTSYNQAWCVASSDSYVHAVWTDNRDGEYEVYYKRSTDNGSTWETVDNCIK